MALFEQLSVKYIADLVRDYKLRAFQAAAFPGNAGVESGGFTQTQEVNPTSGRGGLGHFQDTGARRLAFEAWMARPENAGKNYSAGDYAANYSFLVRELDGEESRVLAPLRASTTPEEATEIVMRVFERPALATANLPKRQDFARRALAAFQASGLDEDELRAQPRPGAEPIAPTSLPPTKTTTAAHGLDEQRLQAIIMQVVHSMLTAILPLLTGRAAPAPVAQPPAPPPTDPATKSTATTVAQNVSGAVLGVVASLAASRVGLQGDPVGVASTITGSIMPLLAIGAGALGIPAPLVTLAGGLFSKLFGRSK